MRPIRPAVPALFLFLFLFLPLFLFAAVAHAGDRKVTRYLDLSNRAHDSVTSIEVAPAGSDAFREKPLGAPLGGGGDATTIEIAGRHCLYDLRLRFRDGRTLVYKDVDICDGGKLVIRPLRRDTGRLVGGETPATRYADGPTTRARAAAATARR